MALSSQPVVRFPVEEKSLPGDVAAWLRRLAAPTFLDCFYAALIVWMYLSGPSGWVGLLMDCDTGWHIRTGDYILEHGAPPRVDIFSFSKPGETWYAWEWLSETVFAVLHRAAGLKGVLLLAGTLIPMATVLLLRRALGLGANLFVALVVTMLGLGASSIHHLARPHLFTIFLLAVSLAAIERDHRQPDRRVWWLVPLTAVWTNLHGGFVALIACLGLYFVGHGLEAFLARRAHAAAAGVAPEPADWSLTRRYAWLTGLCAAVSLLNPYGMQLHIHVAGYLRSDWIKNFVQEFQSPSFRTESMLHFEILLGLGLIAAAALIRRGQWAPALPMLFWAHMALTSVRHVPIFVAVAAPFVARELTLWWDWMVACGRRQSVARILDQISLDLRGHFLRLSAWPVLVVIAVAVFETRWPADFPHQKFPVKAVDRFGDEMVKARVFTMDQWADYLIYRSYPRQRVFFDGRSDFYGPKLGDEYLKLLQGSWDWKKSFDHHRFELALIPVEWPLSSILKLHPEWQVVHDDGLAVLFRKVAPPVRRAGAAAPAAVSGADGSGGTNHRGGPGEAAAKMAKIPSPGLMKTTEASELISGDELQ